MNHHKHPEAGGMGHVSLHAKRGDETIELSVYPDVERPSLLHPLAFLTFYLFPVKATHHPISHSNGDNDFSPVTDSHKIPPELMSNPHEAYELMKQTRESLDAGNTGFSIMPNTSTAALYAFFSNQVNISKIHTGLKTFDRETIDDEVNKTKVTNCSESVHQILKVGGIEKPADLISYHTPSGTHQFFESDPNVLTEKHENIPPRVPYIAMVV